MKPYKFVILTAAAILIGVFMWVFVTSINPDKKPLPAAIDLSEQPVATLEDWKKQYPGIKTFIFNSEPQNLPANLDHPGVITNETFSFPEDGWLVGFVPKQIGASHALHHADIIDSATPNFFCTNGTLNVIVATGEELNQGFLPVGFGYDVSKKSQIIASLMYHNESAVPLSKVHTEFTFFYIPKNKGDLKSAVPFFFDVVGPCMWGDYSIPANSKHTKTMEPEYTVEKPGRIINMGVHMHHYAESFAFRINGKPVKTFTLADTGEGHDLDFPAYVPKNLRIEKGDRLGITAVYNNTTFKDLDAMAEALFYFVPD